MNDCLFCKIIRGEIPSKKVYEDDLTYAFCDIDPKAPIHFLIVPKQHIDSAAQITAENSGAVAACFETAAKLAAEYECADGCRIVNNCGAKAGQSVMHLHFHLLAGRDLTWPPG